jgi:hypothetical protein
MNCNSSAAMICYNCRLRLRASRRMRLSRQSMSGAWQLTLAKPQVGVLGDTGPTSSRNVHIIKSDQEAIDPV